MRYIIGILLIVILIKPSVFACSPNFEDVYYNEPIEIVKGTGGDCYYKFVPPVERRYGRDEGRTEFYLEEGDTEPIFTQQDRYSRDILCAKGADGNHSIVYVDRKGIFFAPREPWGPDWLRFFVNGEVVKSYSPIEIIERENNLDHLGTCGPIYLDEERGFVKDSENIGYVYQVVRCPH